MSDAELKALADEWLRYALEDVATAELVLAQKYPARNACFCAQQAAEKALKGVLCLQRIAFPKTHSLVTLRDLLPATTRPDVSDEALAELSDWAVESRYPGPWPQASDVEASEAIATAQTIIAFARAALNPF